ncbi:MAG: response regulator [bacterium]
MIHRCARELGCSSFDDKSLIQAAAIRFHMPEETFRKAFFARKPTFNRFTHEKEKTIAYLKAVLAETLQHDPVVLSGFCTHLIPRTISHVFRVNLVGDLKYRVAQAIQEQGLTREAATAKILEYDRNASSWTDNLHLDSPWEYDHYDLVLPMDRKTVQEATSAILDHAGKDLFKQTALSLRAIEDFHLAAQVEIALVEGGHFVPVKAHDGNITLRMPNDVIMLSKMEDELRSLVDSVPGVRHITVNPDPDVPYRGMQRQSNAQNTKLLLVDDEREFVHALSERLFMREIGSSVVYDGEQALSFIEAETPEVIILDLKMPGIDGIEVLRRIKSAHPDIQVIMLTGHGSRKDEETCLELGALAYLQKPVDIDVLTKLLDKARHRS